MKLKCVSGNEADLRVGKQIVYIPERLLFRYRKNHTQAIQDYPVDVQTGFVTSWDENTVYCRFYHIQGRHLRTLTYSEFCNKNNLFFYDSKPQNKVDELIDEMRKNKDYYGWVEQTAGGDNA